MMHQKSVSQPGTLKSLLAATAVVAKVLRLVVLLLISGFGLATQVWAVPITYTLEVFGGDASGSLGAVSFSNAIIIFTFSGDTAYVKPFGVVGAQGYKNTAGTSSVTIANNTGVLAQATFQSAAGVYVSVDNTNHGVGFSSNGQPIYPAGMLPGSVDPTVSSTLATYDLKSSLNIAGDAISCVDFGHVDGCSAPLPLPTTAGDLVLDHLPITAALFQAQTRPYVSFNQFIIFNTAILARRFDIIGAFTLGTGSNGINPVADNVNLQIGTYSALIPAGSFKRSDNDRDSFVFVGTLDGVVLKAQLTPVSENRYTFEFQGSGANLTATTTRIPVELTIGANRGATSVKANHHEDSRDPRESLPPWQEMNHHD